MSDNKKLDKVRPYITSKAGFYHAMVRNLYYLPPISCSIVTLDWMHEVRAGNIPCPKYGAVTEMPCPFPPPKSKVIEELQRVGGHDFGITSTREPSLHWCLRALATIDSGHLFFRKDFLPDDKKLGSRDEVDNSDGFFSNLPHLKVVKKIKKERFVVPTVAR
jgi:hypothetical protein